MNNCCCKRKHRNHRQPNDIPIPGPGSILTYIFAQQIPTCDTEDSELSYFQEQDIPLNRGPTTGLVILKPHAPFQNSIKFTESTSTPFTIDVTIYRANAKRPPDNNSAMFDILLNGIDPLATEPANLVFFTVGRPFSFQIKKRVYLKDDFVVIINTSFPGQDTNKLHLYTNDMCQTMLVTVSS